ncbi:MAG: hypothetical protein RML45_10345 [Acetobacteraceae bacterium]|nr:hypothetical protein [Acetobacteraceae bacterium]
MHEPSYLAFLRDAPREWAGLPGAGAEVVPNMHPTPEMLAHGARAPEGVVGRAGWFLADTACAIGPDTWASAVASAGAALAAADAVAGGARAAYALCRPPGHHAYSRRAGGHCYLNNAALAAEAAAPGRVPRASPCSTSTCTTATVRRGSSGIAATC